MDLVGFVRPKELSISSKDDFIVDGSLMYIRFVMHNGLAYTLATVILLVLDLLSSYF